MKSSFSIVALAVCAGLSLRAGEADLPGLESIPKIVAEVNGKPIQRTELIRELVGSSGGAALERLVHRIVIAQAAAAQHVTITDQDIEMQYAYDTKELARDLIHVEHDPKAVVPMEETVRTKFGMSVAEYKNIIIRQRLLARRCMASDVNPTDADLHKFVDRYPDLFQEPVWYRAAHILITPLDPRDMTKSGSLKSPLARMVDLELLRQERIDRERDEGINTAAALEFSGFARDGTPVKGKEGSVSIAESNAAVEASAAWSKCKAEAEQLVQELRAYPNRWNDIVRRSSQDPLDQVPRLTKVGAPPPRSLREKAGKLPGEVGWFHKRGPMVAEFYDGARSIRPGEIGGPILTRFGYHIVKMLDVKFPKIKSFAECRDRARQLYIDNEIELRSASWLAQLDARADLKTEKASLWPPLAVPAASPLDIDTPRLAANEDTDPVVGSVNGVPVLRSAVWRELLRSEGDEALRRLINREVILGILKDNGLAYMEWLCANPMFRLSTSQPPPRQPIRISEDQLQIALNADRLDYDVLLRNKKEHASMDFDEFMFKRYGQTPAEHRRALEASLVLQDAIRRKVVPGNKAEFERTLKFEFAMARQQYSQSPWFEISHILIVPSGGMLLATPEQKEAAFKIAKDLSMRCQTNPQEFDQLVSQFSDDTPENKAEHGKLGGCYSDRVTPDLPEGPQFFNYLRTENFDAGRITPPLMSARGYHIVRLDRRHPARQAEFSEKRKQIERDYINEQAKFYADVWVRALNSRAIVKHFLYKPSFAEEWDDLPKDNFMPPRD